MLQHCTWSWIVLILSSLFHRENLPGQFKFKDYCPQVFRNLRERFGIEDQDYQVRLLTSTSDRAEIKHGQKQDEKQRQTFTNTQRQRFLSVFSFFPSKPGTFLHVLSCSLLHLHSFVWYLHVPGGRQRVICSAHNTFAYSTQLVCGACCMCTLKVHYLTFYSD